MVLDTFRRWMGSSAGAAIDKSQEKALLTWAKEDGHAFKTVMGMTGGAAVVETPAGWRVEWGPSQRPYYPGQEIRFRFDAGLPPDIQMLLITRSLAHTLETDVYQRFTDAMQTQMDHTLPDEMRWLPMHARVPLVNPPDVARRFLLLSNVEEIARRWMDDDLVHAVEAAAASWWTDTCIALLTVNRGMLTLRMSAEGVTPAVLRQVGTLFDTAARKLVPAMG